MLSKTQAESAWNHPFRETRVRGSAYLWGSAGVKVDLKFDKPLHLHIQNNPFGQPLAIATVIASGAQTAIGTLAQGEWVTIPLQHLSGVLATCGTETTVLCLIH